MGSVDWDLLVRAHTEVSIEQITLAFVINYNHMVFIARRHPEDYLNGCYELPQGILGKEESIIDASRRILASHFGVQLSSIDQFLHTFTYVSANQKRCRTFTFSARVENPREIKLDRNDHGVWIQIGEYHYWPVITHFGEAIFNFWTGEGYNRLLADTLIEQAKRENIWRFKIRVALYRGEEILLLKRARRNLTLPLYYELPGKEFTFLNEIDSVIVASTLEQTGWAPERITRYIGHYDYKSDITGAPVREFFFAALAQDQPIKLSEHAYAVWVKDLNNLSISVTESVRAMWEPFLTRFFFKLPESVDLLPPVYFDPLDTEERRKLSRFFDAQYDLETTGKIDVEALKGYPLRKRFIPADLHKLLGL